MHDGYEVEPEQLRAHAGKLDDHAENLRQAGDAARTTRLGGEAYGKICFFVPLALNAVAEPVTAALTSAQRAVDESAAALRSVVNDYESRDQEIATDLERIADGIGGGP